MAEPIEWDWDSVKNLIGTMWQIDYQIFDITNFAKDHVLDTSGLTGALSPLADFFNELKPEFDDAATIFQNRFESLIHATEASTNYVKRLDAESGQVIRRGPYRTSIS